ncbi:hypothetical protein GPL15_08070 [Clostridium sp. MCC353]|uniref:BTAD domain-containing putative transcriptional regulator n=1 Tax=Clostridium sp. MCC353 TaxID=2592646 RepID=UPI001C01E029|nr:BTAD domain-containing putative transcriptional regulator [Clostridium sp. MCC353]MBT9776457.1 hypothetical protein [Clostridium sp. MCC353]
MENDVSVIKQGCLNVNMMGGFSLLFDEKPLTLACNINNKSIHLLSALLYYGDEGIARNKLLAMLYGREEKTNPANSLRAVIFRLRKLLAESGLPEDEYIRYQNGVYYWKPDHITTVVDAVCFERSAEEALNQEERRLDQLVSVCKRYCGEFLPLMAAEEWVAVISVRYQELYFSCLREACSQLKARGEYEEMLELCTRAAQIYPFEEWQLLQIDCLMALKRYKEALGIYEYATNMMFKELGLPPSEKMLARFRAMCGQIHYDAGAIMDVKGSLKEKESKSGAYYCGYPSFIDSYRLIVRMTERSGQSVYLMLCTLTDKKGIPLDHDDEGLIQVVENLYRAIGRSLRRGDLYTRYSPNQFLILLTGLCIEACSIITDRIDRQFEMIYSGRKVEIRYYVTSAADMDSQESQAQLADFHSGWED